MAGTAKRDEIFFYIASQEAPRLNVMDLDISGTAAALTSPAVALKHLAAEPAVGISVQAKPALS